MNNFVQEWIGERGIVQFVVAPPAEAIKVNEDVFSELPLIIEGQFGDQIETLGIINVHVENRSIDTLGQVRTISTTSPSFAGSREPDLIVYNHVNRTTHIELRCPCHDQHLLVYALTDERCITMKLNIKDTGGKVFLCVIAESSVSSRLLLRTSFAHRNRINCLQVRGIVEHGQSY